MRFVILHHVPPAESGRAPHWDLLLDAYHGALRTWALADEPQAGVTLAATPLADHRRVFLVYEGPLTGGRGFVTRWDAGECELPADASDRVELNLKGARVNGRLALSVTPGVPS